MKCIITLAVFLLSTMGGALEIRAGELRAGVAKVDITDRTGPVNDPSFAKALVLKSDQTTLVLITIDAVAIGEIGRIKNGFLADVRGQLDKKLGVPPSNVVITASHCHGLVRPDSAQLAQLVVQAVEDAAKNLVPVKAGAGTEHEDRISENRRLKMKDGSEVDMRRAYSMPRDEDVAGVGQSIRKLASCGWTATTADRSRCSITSPVIRS
jgi:hypothetical protein